MSNQEQVKLLKQGVEGWNQWRQENPNIKVELNQVDLSLTDLSFINLSFANINLADLHGTKLRLADLSNADLSEANLRGADLRKVDLQGAVLSGADLSGADLRRANLKSADLRGAKLIFTNLTYTNFKQARLDGARFMGASIYGADFEATDLSNVIGFDDAHKEKPDESMEAGPPMEHVSLIDGNLSRGELKKKLRQYWEYRPILQEDDAPVSVVLQHASKVSHRKRLDSVHFAVTSLPAVIAGDHFHLDFWMYLENKLEQVIRQAKQELNTEKIHISTEGPVELERGTRVTVELNINRLAIDPPRKDVLWNGKISKAGFIVTVPKEAEEDIYDGKATVSCNGMQIAQVRFLIQVGDTVSSVDLLPIEVKVIRKAFASYASEDRVKVLGRIQGMQKILPKLEVFIDVVSLRSGQKWEQELWKVIPTYDVFYLFWSADARRSDWVDKEWRCALKTRDLDYIDPIPLVSPEEAPPPPELAGKHFNDWMLPYMRAEKDSDKASD